VPAQTQASEALKSSLQQSCIYAPKKAADLKVDLRLASTAPIAGSHLHSYATKVMPTNKPHHVQTNSRADN